MEQISYAKMHISLVTVDSTAHQAVVAHNSFNAVLGPCNRVGMAVDVELAFCPCQSKTLVEPSQKAILELKSKLKFATVADSGAVGHWDVEIMGLCALSPMTAEDREQERVAEFVRYAITADLVKLREMISKYKMNPNAKDRFGMNAVHWASYVGELECIQELIKAGGSPSATDSNGRNALHHACRKDRDEVVRYLVTTAKVDINSRSENQDTPLHKAVRGKSIKVLEVLLKLGADPSLRNEQNRTPLEELEAAMALPTPTPTTESNGSNRVTSARLSTHNEIYHEPLDYIGLALQPVRRGSVSRTDVRSFRSRSVTDFSDRTAREEPAQWATTPVSKPAALYVSPPVSATEHVRLRKNLRYAGKRVIMALRVKSTIPDTEKMELMRLILQKHNKENDSTTA